MRKIFVIGGDTHYTNWMQGELVDTVEEANLVCLTGGEDVSPYLYQQPAHPRTYSNAIRDKYEIDLARKAIELGKKLIGICRGSQLSCVLSEGELIQHQPNPYSYHEIITYDNKILSISSTHHQAQFPFNLPEEDYKILAWTDKMLKFHENGYQEEMNPPVEVEICWYKKTNILAIQGHPEYMSQTSETVIWLQELLNKFMNNEL